MSSFVYECPNCEAKNATAEFVRDKFPYGVGINPVVLEAEVQMFSCPDCNESWTGEQAEAARASAVDRHKVGIHPYLLRALIAQHHAIDTLFSMLIAKTLNHEQPFYPSQCGQPWEAIKEGKAAIALAGGEV